MNGPVVIDAQGNQLLRFARLAEEELAHLDRTIPLPLSLVVAVSESGILLVFNRRRHEWELPGGMIDSGESPREAAAREYVEETGQAAPVLEIAGAATFELMPDHRVEYAAVFLARVTTNLTPFEPTTRSIRSPGGTARRFQDWRSWTPRSAGWFGSRRFPSHPRQSPRCVRTSSMRAPSAGAEDVERRMSSGQVLVGKAGDEAPGREGP